MFPPHLLLGVATWAVTLDAIISLETWEVFLMATYPILTPGLQGRLITDLYKDVDSTFTSMVLIAFWTLL